MTLLRLALLGSLVSLGSLFVAQSARAQDSITYSDPDTAAPGAATLYGELAFGGTSSDSPGPDSSVSTFTFMLGGRVAAAKPLYVAFDWGFANTSVTADAGTPFLGGPVDDNAVVVANPFLAGHFVVDFSVGAFDIGFGLTAPFADADSGAGLASYATAERIRGLWNRWLWLPNTFALAAPARLTFDLVAFKLSFDGALAMLIPTVGNGDGQAVGQFSALGAFEAGPFDFGLRAQLVGLIGSDTPDDAQFGFGPYARLDLGPVFMSAYLHMNVDDPYGFAFSDYGYWGLFFTGGGSF